MYHKLFNKYVSKKRSLILLYHATFKTPPKDLKNKLHNVSPDVLYKQLDILKNYYTFLPLDEWFLQAGKPKTAAVTFDDAYQSVFREGLPILESLNIPATIFVNGCTLNGEVIWRDKIRYLINKRLVEDFLNWLPHNNILKSIKSDLFYRKTKKKINSQEIADLLSLYFYENKIKLDSYCIDNVKNLIEHPLISYGNHSLNHYVLSNLSYKQQAYEIEENEKLLRDSGVSMLKIFSLPFGGTNDYNNHTIDICKCLDYKGVLFSRNRLNKQQTVFNDGVRFGERFMVPSSFNLLFKTINKLYIKDFIR